MSIKTNMNKHRAAASPLSNVRALLHSNRIPVKSHQQNVFVNSPRHLNHQHQYQRQQKHLKVRNSFFGCDMNKRYDFESSAMSSVMWHLWEDDRMDVDETIIHDDGDSSMKIDDDFSIEIDDVMDETDDFLMDVDILCKRKSDVPFRCIPRTMKGM